MVSRKKGISPAFMKIELRPFFTSLRFSISFFKVYFVNKSIFRSYNVSEKGKILTVACKL